MSGDPDSYKISAKREAQDDMEDREGPSKRPRSGGRAVDVRFLVQSKNAGAIIGKGGSNINRLRTEFTASVTVPDCPGPERILAVVADIDTLGDILLDILPKLDDYSHHRNMEFDCEMRMLLHQSHAGCLIGKGGSRIKELREKTGAQIKIFSNCCPNSTERIVQITGYPNVVVDCVKEICHVISQAPIKGPNKQYDPHNFNPMFANEYGGFEDSGPKGRGRGGSYRGSYGGSGGGAGRGRGGGGFGGGYGGRGMMGQSPNMGNRFNHMSGGSGGSGNLGGWVTDAAAYGGNRMMGSMNGSNAGSYGSNAGSYGSNAGSYGSNAGSYGSSAGSYGSSAGSYGMVPPVADKPMGPGMGGPRAPMMNTSMGGGYQGGLGGGPGMNGPGPAARGYMGGPVRGAMGGPMKGPGYVQPVPNTGELFSAKPQGNPSGSYAVVMKIPNDVAGAIIGKGGQRIRKIRRDSAATINIEEATQGSNERVITISGSLNQAQMGQYLMQQSVRDNQGGGGGGGRRF